MQDSRKHKSEKEEDKDLPGYPHYPSFVICLSGLRCEAEERIVFL